MEFKAVDHVVLTPLNSRIGFRNEQAKELSKQLIRAWLSSKSNWVRILSKNSARKSHWISSDSHSILLEDVFLISVDAKTSEGFLPLQVLLLQIYFIFQRFCACYKSCSSHSRVVHPNKSGEKYTLIKSIGSITFFLSIISCEYLKKSMHTYAQLSDKYDRHWYCVCCFIV